MQLVRVDAGHITGHQGLLFAIYLQQYSSAFDCQQFSILLPVARYVNQLMAVRIS